ncbi:exodeoxyribonuclease VII small subunit [Helicobacter cholecystus]|uniref:Exodeoxyribonuclease VII small subunit n=1 Tax=Helicobacter cholecystus TaxID=45498 RepID=A0A3D8IWQ2_9HELI|nr:exodeoxyribonuclease VII small subunit [Helicobacter cholecystus]RDU69044.1 exodeoxyribonuclease VII small subunit [Helicobacter cholecystus]VEJ24574.1 putative exodeoxyribonuclease VII small subunit [Helicobacter cholecystus]
MKTLLNFEELVELSKKSLDELSHQNLSLKESLEIYKQGLAYLNEAQRLLEEAKLEYQEISNPQETGDLKKV